MLYCNNTISAFINVAVPIFNYVSNNTVNINNKYTNIVYFKIAQ